MKRKISISLLWSCIVGILSAVWVFVFDLIIGFPGYINSLQESNWEGLGIIAILVVGAIAGIVLLVIAILCAVAASGMNKCTTVSKMKGFAIFGIIAQLLLAGGLITYAVIMFMTYPGGYVGKISYIALAVLFILLAILNIVSLAKIKKAEPTPTAVEQVGFGYEKD